MLSIVLAFFAFSSGRIKYFNLASLHVIAIGITPFIGLRKPSEYQTFVNVFKTVLV